MLVNIRLIGLLVNLSCIIIFLVILWFFDRGFERVVFYMEVKIFKTA